MQKTAIRSLRISTLLVFMAAGLAACSDRSNPPDQGVDVGPDAATDSSVDLYADLPGVDTLPADTLPDDLPGPDSPTFDLSPPNFDVTGSWSGTYNGALVGSGSLTATLVQTGGQVTGSISMLVISNAPFKGTVSGNQFMGSGTASLGSASFKMTIATGGNSMSGTFTGTALGSTDSGTVSLTRIIPEAGPVDVGLADMVGPAEAGGAD